ncbi:hypothetical protein MPH_02680 [Macrophomina phaseolina MS6]|uniref:Uncharacterized protein n=1 Tax=Macrophomina phaseolina (strain MS6) TaxID=1126212 RepID=K2SCE7_MACPH|nr:hypothetical protein MPH_02680 [Macrophomina phaseolina MS6]
MILRKDHRAQQRISAGHGGTIAREISHLWILCGSMMEVQQSGIEGTDARKSTLMHTSLPTSRQDAYTTLRKTSLRQVSTEPQALSVDDSLIHELYTLPWVHDGYTDCFPRFASPFPRRARTCGVRSSPNSRHNVLRFSPMR